MKKVLLFVFTILSISVLNGCDKKAPETITGEVRSFYTKILSDSVAVTVLSVDSEEDGKTKATIDITVDSGDSMNRKVINQLLSMSMHGYYQPVFARFKKLKNFDYLCTEQAVVSYDVSGTPPVYIFPSDQYVASN